MTSLWTCRVCALQNRDDDTACVKCRCPKNTDGVALSARKAAWEKGGTFSSQAKAVQAKSKTWLSKEPRSTTRRSYLSTTSGQYLGTSICVYLMAYIEYRSPISGRGLGRILGSIRDTFGPNASTIFILTFATSLLAIAYMLRGKK